MSRHGRPVAAAVVRCSPASRHAVTIKAITMKLWLVLTCEYTAHVVMADVVMAYIVTANVVMVVV